MIVDGLVLTIITILLSAGIIVCNHWIKKITNYYWFWIVIGSFFFIWLVAFRFAADWSTYAHAIIIDPSEYGSSVIISRALLLDVCPFCALAMCVSLIVDPTRKVARSLSPLALIGGWITIGSLCFDSDIGATLTPQFIFFGTGTNPCYFIMHFAQIMMATGVMVNTPRNGWKGTLLTLIITVCYYSYVAIVMASTGCAWNVSGLSINDWVEGEYHFVAQIFNIPPKVCQIIGIPILGLVGCGIIAIKDYVFDRGWFNYGNAFSGKWYSWYNYNRFVKQRIV